MKTKLNILATIVVALAGLSSQAEIPSHVMRGPSARSPQQVSLDFVSCNAFVWKNGREEFLGHNMYFAKNNNASFGAHHELSYKYNDQDVTLKISEFPSGLLTHIKTNGGIDGIGLYNTKSGVPYIYFKGFISYINVEYSSPIVNVTSDSSADGNKLGVYCNESTEENILSDDPEAVKVK